MHRFFLLVSRLMTFLGGIVLTALILMICVSILGRTLASIAHADFIVNNAGWLSDLIIGAGVGPVNGDFELVEAGIAFAIFAFLPLTQITAGHATVDIFTAWLPNRANRVLSVLIDVLFAVVLFYIAFQLKEGMDSKIRSGTTTFLLQFPIWWAYAASLAGAAVAAAIAIYVAIVRVVELFTGRMIIAEEGADH